MVKNKRLSEVSIPRNYQRRQCYLSTQNWLDSQGLVIAGYWDKVAGVNLLHLVALWREAQLDEETLSEQYPDAAEYFQIRVMTSGDQAHEETSCLSLMVVHILRFGAWGMRLTYTFKF